MKKIIVFLMVLSITFINPMSMFLSIGSVQADVKSFNDFSEFYRLSDPDLLDYVEDRVYLDLVRHLNNEDYFVEKVEAVYISKEFLEEIAYNSQANIFFGYTLAELDEQFQGKRYVFTLGDDGTTVVQEFEAYDDTYDRVIRNVAIGSGVIFLCVTVSVVSGGLGAPAISAIFMASAKTGAEFALGAGIISGVSSGIITGIQTGDFSKALKEAALNGSEKFKWGAITGTVTGGFSEFGTLQSMTANGLTMNEAAIIQKESNLPTEIIRSFRNMDEYTIYKQAGLRPEMVNNKLALIRSDIACCAMVPDENNPGALISNLELMLNGNAAFYYSNTKKVFERYQLHHIGQKNDSFLAILTDLEHDMPGLHISTEGINRNEFAKIRKAFWKSVGNILVENGSCSACPIN